MIDKIIKHLDAIEQDEQVRILYAVESGSRAWGFASRNSDYDVRFIYIHQPDWYLSIRERRDVIERPISNDLDISGWDNPRDTEYEDTKAWIESMKGGPFDPEQFDPKAVVFEDPAEIFKLCFSR